MANPMRVIFVGIQLAVIKREIPEIMLIMIMTTIAITITMMITMTVTIMIMIKVFGAHLVGSMHLQIFQGWLGQFTADFCGTWPEHQQARRSLMYSHCLTLFDDQCLFFGEGEGSAECYM